MAAGLSPDVIVNQIEKLAGLRHVMEASAVIAAAFSGMIAARNKRADVVGIYILACITAFGGGTVRDVLLDRRPLFWVEYSIYPILILILSILFVYLPNIFSRIRPLARLSFNWIDAIGLGLFSISGVSFALIYRIPYFPSILFGVITGTFGGVLRDLFLLEIPIIFRQTTLYATCSFLGCWMFLIALILGCPQSLASILGSVTVVILRMAAVRYGWKLGGAHLREPGKGGDRSSKHQ